jgi:putative membrane-bound dehydrogenase-like protein
MAAVSLAVSLLCLCLHAADPFAEGVRTTEPLTPEQQQKTFHLPPGFKIQLVAAEPDLRKPMNMAFDSAGRLWVTESREYPWPTNTAPRDTIRIFSDFATNGRAQKVTTFATNLNIPIGIYPFRSAARVQGLKVEELKSVKRSSASSTVQPSNSSTNLTWKCIAWSIPNIWLFEDIDGDGVADKKEILYGPFDFSRDTHGNQASFRRGLDGWVYATHGFNNRSTVKGRDGHEITMNSGNTYRFRLDGSRIEHWTHGQVNPYGLSFDPLGNLYSADCHSSPIYQLLRGAWYPSFGAPHDGLGFAPVTLQHSHGSTAICGITYISDPSWPAEFQDNIFIGNVMTSRINRDQINFTGSTSKGKELPDFLTTDDPWFRPVDLQWGPDGALYVADFYNRIIGHYEVPLTHPGRDRERGRIWRIVPPAGVNVRKLKLISGEPTSPAPRDAMLNEFLSSNPTRRALAREELALLPNANEHGLITQAARGGWHFRQADDREGLMTSCLWHLQRAGQLDDKILLDVLVDRDEAIRVHALRILSERGLQAAATSESTGNSNRASGLNATLLSAVTQALNDPSAFVQRAAVEALGASPAFENIPPLLSFFRRVPAEDNHLLHATRMALRDQLTARDCFTRIEKGNLPEADQKTMASLAVSIGSPEAGSFLLQHLQRFAADKDTSTRYLRHATRHAPVSQLDLLVELIRGRFNDDLDLQATLFKPLQEGLTQRGLAPPPAVRTLGEELARALFQQLKTMQANWHNAPLPGAVNLANPWTLQERVCADDQRANLLSSFPLGEPLTGTLRSDTFTLPAELSFYLAGHDGAPGQPIQRRNFVRLYDAATGKMLREVQPPRNDIARNISWDLKEFSGQRGFIEVVDANSGRSYAWLAVGRFVPSLPQLALSDPNFVTSRQQSAAELAGSLKLAALEPEVSRLLADTDAEMPARAAAARARLALRPDPLLAPFAVLIADGTLPLALRAQLCVVTGQRSAAALPAVLEALRAASHGIQVKLALALAATQTGAEELLQQIESGTVSPRLLQDRGLQARLLATDIADLKARTDKLTSGMTPLSDAVVKLIEERRRAYTPAKGSSARGVEVFTKNCAVCHQISGQGGLVGPQLDGIGNRGLERLLEDLLDPNRNVDVAFRTQNLILKDGEMVSGLMRRDEGELVVLADANGKEISVPKNQVKERRQSELSLMPANLAELLPEPELFDLLAYLLANTGRTAK